MYCEIIKELRERKGLMQEDIAKMLGIKQQQYSRYENGTEMPYKFLIILSNFYEVTIDYILKGKKYERISKKNMDNIIK